MIVIAFSASENIAFIVNKQNKMPMSFEPRHPRHTPVKYVPEQSGPDAPYYEALPYSNGREQIEQVLDLLYRRRWVVILTFLIVAGSVATYTFMLEPEYEAYSFVMLDLSGRNTKTQQNSDAPGEENIFARSDRSLSGEIQMLYLSDQLYRRVQQRSQLAANSSTTGEASADNIPIKGTTRFDPEGKSGNNIIRITGISPSARDATILANLYAEEYVQLTKEASRTHITATRQLLEAQEQKRQQDLRDVEERIKQYRSAKGGERLDQGSAFVVNKIGQLEAGRDDARIELQTHQAQLRSLEKEVADTNPRLATRIASNVDQQISDLQGKITEKETEKREILLQNPNLESDSPELGTINSEIQQLKDQVGDLSRQYVQEATAAGGLSGSGTGIDYLASLRQKIAEEKITISGLQKRITVMENRLRTYQGDLKTIPEQSLELARLERMHQYADRMYQAVVERLQDVRITEESEPGYAHVLRVASVPLSPVRPDKTKYLVLGVFFGLLLGLGIAVVRDKLDNRIYKPDQLRGLGYTVLGTVPNLKPLIKAENEGGEFVDREGERLATSLVTLLNPLSPIVEAYRHLRTNIQFSRPDVVVQTIMVTSASVGEGKSTTATNLAVSMAEAGRRTLLIDADLRRPQVNELLGIDLGPGLVHFLLKEPDFDQQVVKSKIDNLYVMPAGKIVPRSSELFATKRVRDFIDDMRSRFDVIIIDTPPVRVATDAALISTQCDATLFVVRAGQSKEGEVEMGMEALASVGTQVIGTVLNGFDVSMAYGYKYRYQHYDQYAQYTKKYGNAGYSHTPLLSQPTS